MLDISIESHPIWEEEELRDIIWGWLVANLFAWLKESKSTIRPRMNHPPGHYVLRTFRNKEVIMTILNSLGTIREHRTFNEEYICQRRAHQILLNQ